MTSQSSCDDLVVTIITNNQIAILERYSNDMMLALRYWRPFGKPNSDSKDVLRELLYSNYLSLHQTSFGKDEANKIVSILLVWTNNSSDNKIGELSDPLSREDFNKLQIREESEGNWFEVYIQAHSSLITLLGRVTTSKDAELAASGRRFLENRTRFVFSALEKFRRGTIARQSERSSALPNLEADINGQNYQNFWESSIAMSDLAVDVYRTFMNVLNQIPHKRILVIGTFVSQFVFLLIYSGYDVVVVDTGNPSNSALFEAIESLRIIHDRSMITPVNENALLGSLQVLTDESPGLPRFREANNGAYAGIIVLFSIATLPMEEIRTLLLRCRSFLAPKGVIVLQETNLPASQPEKRESCFAEIIGLIVELGLRLVLRTGTSGNEQHAIWLTRSLN